MIVAGFAEFLKIVFFEFLALQRLLKFFAHEGNQILAV